MQKNVLIIYGKSDILLLFTHTPNSRVFGMIFAKSTSFAMPFCMILEQNLILAKCVHSVFSALLVIGYEVNSNDIFIFNVDRVK